MKNLVKSAKIIIFLSIAFLSLFSVSMANAYTEYSKTISRLGVQGSTPYVYFVEGVEQSCNELYMSDDSTKKLLYTQLLAAKLSGLKIARVDYSIVNGVCQVNLLQLN